LEGEVRTHRRDADERQPRRSCRQAITEDLGNAEIRHAPEGGNTLSSRASAQSPERGRDGPWAEALQRHSIGAQLRVFDAAPAPPANERYVEENL